MKSITDLNRLDASAPELSQELAAIKAESIGWQHLGESCYLHAGDDATEILIIGSGSVTADMANLNMLWIV